MSFEFGDVVLVPFPFTDQTTVKQRPAVVISSRADFLERPDVVMMAITSQLRPERAVGEVWLTAWREAGLLKPSAIKPVLPTFEQRLIRRTLGRLGSEDQISLRNAIHAVIG